MIQSDAVSALRTMEGLAEAQDARPTQTRTDAATSADATARGPALINEIQDIRKKFTDLEIKSVSMALGSMSGLSAPEGQAQVVDSTLALIAARRDKGEDVFLIVVSAKEGGGIAMVRSASELQADLDSDNPASMGSFTGRDGKTRYIRDLVREVIGLDEALSKNPNTPVAEGVVKELRAYIQRPELDELKNLKLDDKKDEGALRFKKDGASVSIVFFEAKPPPAAGYKPPGAQA